MECYIGSDPSKIGYTKRMMPIWREIGVYETRTEQRLADQGRVISRNAWLTDMKIEELIRKVVNENKGCDDADLSGKELQGRSWEGYSEDINTNREQHSSRQSPRGSSALARLYATKTAMLRRLAKSNRGMRTTA